MAETLLFKIPTPSLSQDTPLYVNWYQSVNGIVWGQPIDTVQISDLEVDSSTGKYIWHSDLAIEYMYNQLKTVSINDIESDTGIILPPKPKSLVDTTPSAIYAERISSGSNAFSIGDTIELLLDVEEDVAEILGNTIPVYIIDKFGNSLYTINSTLIDGGIYSAVWKVPKSLKIQYNANKEIDTDVDIYCLSDKWIMPDNTYIKFDFKVSKAPAEQPVSDNSIITIELDDIQSTDNSSASEKIKFTTKLSPAYCSVEDVVSVYPEFLSELDPVDIASEIVSHSMNLDYTMKPDKIIYMDRFLNACRNYVAHDVAENFVTSGPLNIESESKELDTFKVSKKYNFSKGVLKQIKEHLKQFEPFVLAGGEDTPYTTKTFVKGLMDPNRPDLGRSSLDIYDNYPWVNRTTKSYSIQLEDGSSIEIRGTRTIGFYSRNSYVKNW